jgi:hypothetical protein
LKTEKTEIQIDFDHQTYRFCCNKKSIENLILGGFDLFDGTYDHNIFMMMMMELPFMKRRYGAKFQENENCLR